MQGNRYADTHTRGVIGMSHPQPSQPLAYYRIVWEIVRQVPPSTVTTFGQIASMIPSPVDINPTDYEKLAPRWVGDAMNAVSRVDEPTVPWHRVINSKGTISLPPESISFAQQRARLKAEGVFDEKERADFSRHGWEGPSAAWLAEKGLRVPKSLKQSPEENNGQLRLF
jgi:methylated-DNA-protein-cysteine methyltransferase related protein